MWIVLVYVQISLMQNLSSSSLKCEKGDEGKLHNNNIPLTLKISQKRAKLQQTKGAVEYGYCLKTTGSTKSGDFL